VRAVPPVVNQTPVTGAWDAPYACCSQTDINPVGQFKKRQDFVGFLQARLFVFREVQSGSGHSVSSDPK
jgi:hypothetical protein